MKILQLVWESFGNKDIEKAFISEGHFVTKFNTSQEELLGNMLHARLTDALSADEYDIVFGFNYFPQVAIACKEKNIPYYAWVYDNPCSHLYSCTVIFPTNNIFVFDSDTYIKFAMQGIETVKFLPMAADASRLAGVARRNEFTYDISFVGSLYNEEHNFYRRMIDKGISDYTKGYLTGLMEAQKLLYGVNIIEDNLSDKVLADCHNALPLEPENDSVIDIRTLFSDFVINRQITAEERMSMLTKIGNTFGDKYKIDLFTRDSDIKINGINNHGSIDFYEKAPGVYGESKINLNISLRSIVNGIPLRCFEILGSGGFLLTNYQGDFAQIDLIDGVDYVSFESDYDMINKIEYYLNHEEERRTIAENGYKKILEAHTYVHRVKEMLDSE